MKALIEKKPVFLNVSLMRLYPVNIVGQDPAEILLQSPKQYGYLKTFSALMHIIIYIKIQMFKRKDTPRRKNLFLLDLIFSKITISRAGTLEKT